MPVFAERAGADRAEIQFFVLLGAAILAIKLAFLWIDNVPLFFMGDSGGYLGSALEDHVPPERSFAYGQVFIRSLLWLFGSLRAVVAAQVVSSAGSALLLAAVLRVGFDVSRVTAGLAALAYAVEPLALFYERMLMTDNLATFFMAGFVFVGVAYLRRPRIAPLPWLSVFSTAGIALRTSLLPTVLSCAAVLPLLAPGRFKIRLCHLALLAVLTLAGHAAYWHWFHKQTGWPAGYRGDSGFFLLASWLPLMTPADFPDPALYDRIMSQVHFPLSHRTGQLFSRRKRTPAGARRASDRTHAEALWRGRLRPPPSDHAQQGLARDGRALVSGRAAFAAALDWGDARGPAPLAADDLRWLGAGQPMGCGHSGRHRPGGSLPAPARLAYTFAGRRTAAKPGATRRAAPAGS